MTSGEVGLHDQANLSCSRSWMFCNFARRLHGRDEPKDDAAGKGIVLETPAKKEAPPPKADLRAITLHVDGMSERLKLI